MTLKQRREQLKLTQKEVSDEIGIAESTYQRYEYGWTIPKVTTAIKIARALGSTVEALYGRFVIKKE